VDRWALLIFHDGVMYGRPERAKIQARNAVFSSSLDKVVSGGIDDFTAPL
jgi:hypothetical protein